MDEGRMQGLLKRMRDVGHGMPHEIAAAQSEVSFIAANELAGKLAQLSADVFEAKRTLGDRLSELTTAITEASKASSKQTDALVRWTKWYVFTTIAILIVTAASVAISLLNRG